jgi:hypothetical protein
MSRDEYVQHHPAAKRALAPVGLVDAAAVPLTVSCLRAISPFRFRDPLGVRVEKHGSDCDTRPHPANRRMSAGSKHLHPRRFVRGGSDTPFTALGTAPRSISQSWLPERVGIDRSSLVEGRCRPWAALSRARAVPRVSRAHAQGTAEALNPSACRGVDCFHDQHPDPLLFGLRLPRPCSESRCRHRA